jgi:hypothetical protein
LHASGIAAPHILFRVGSLQHGPIGCVHEKPVRATFSRGRKESVTLKRCEAGDVGGCFCEKLVLGRNCANFTPDW